MKRFILCVFLGFLGWVMVSCAPEQQAGTLKKGRELEDQGNYAGALENYQRMENQEFGRICSHNLQLLYGDILAEMEKINSNPHAPDAHFSLGTAYYERSQAIPDELDNRNNFGFDAASYLSQQRTYFQAQAQTELMTATQLKPDYVDALVLQARIHEERDEPDQAIAIYQRLVSQQANEPEVLSHLGLLLYEQEKFGQGIELAAQAVSRFPGDAQARFILGDLYAREGDIAESVAEFQQALCADPSYDEAYYRIAQTFLNEDDFLNAERVLRAGLQHNAESMQLGIFYQALRTILDTYEQEEADEIFRSLEGDIVSEDMAKLNWSEQSLGLQLRYLRLRMKLIQRQQPYFLSCTYEEENPYFASRIKQTQHRIEEVEHLLAQSEE